MPKAFRTAAAIILLGLKRGLSGAGRAGVPIIERANMRSFIFIALLVFASPAIVQNWQEYSYPDYSFRVAFPGDPQIDATTYRVTDNRRVEAHVYFVRRDNAEFKPSIAELADAGLEPISVIDYAIKTLSKRGEVKVDLPHHVMQVFGRQLSIVEGNGSRVAAAVFVYRGRLYQVEGKLFPAGNDATADATRFVQSLLFTGGGPSPDETGAAQSTCDGSHGPGGAGAHGAAVTDCRDRELPKNGDVPRSPLPENGSLMPSAGEPTRKSI
jgi:hypothetical protein